METTEILSQLNAGQRAAVEYNEGPSLVIAGAGSGKTRVLTYKIAYLITMGMKPWNILALTFTNKAANEMKSRIARIVGEEQARYIFMGTFHSIFSRILRQESGLLGYDGQFTIYDESDSRSLIKSIIKEFGLEDKKQYKPASVHNKISMAKNCLIGSDEYQADPSIQGRDAQEKLDAVGQIYKEYQLRCKKANAMDFDDLLMVTYKLFDEHEDVRQKWAHKFQYVLVDEYQDTNRVQQKIVEQLTRENQRVCVVGDDAQSIYAFRGANIDNILDFNTIYPGAKMFKLEQNYRSTQRIVQAANSLIKRNVRQIEKNVFSENEVGEELLLKHALSDKEEAAIVCNKIREIKRQDGCEYSDFAILYRTNAQSRSFEEECLKQGIPYRIFGGLSFYQRKEIKDIVAYFRLVSNHADEEAFKRIINYPARGIGDTTVKKIADMASRYNASLWEVAYEPEKFQLGVNAGTLNKLKKFTSLILSFSDQLDTLDAYDLGQDIIKRSEIAKDLYSSTDADYLSRQENLEEFLAAMQDFVEGMREEGREQEATLPHFLQEISLQTDKESEDGSGSKVSMMTVHSAKGLEFPTVFVVGMEETIFPSQMSFESIRQLEEERRLFYVAITRAEKHCILTCAQNRWRYGNMEFLSPSRFLNDIDPRLIRIEGGGAGRGTSVRGWREDTSCNSFGRSMRNEYGHGADRIPGYGNRMQNSRPVADQFRADPKPKITHNHTEEPQSPFSPAFQRELEQARSNTRMGHGARAGGFRQATDSAAVRPAVPEGFKKVRPVPQVLQAASSFSTPALSVGNIIQHQRFGIGTVKAIEGTGDNCKATVEFENTGTKQLLLKFAKFSVVK